MELFGEPCNNDYSNYKDDLINILRTIVETCESREKKLLPKEHVDMLRDVIDPTRINGRYRSVILETGGIRLIIPGSGYEWDSLNHLVYLVDWVILQTQEYQYIFDISEISKIKERIYNLDKTGIMGIAAIIRDKAPDIPHRTLNDIIHCGRDEEHTPKHIRRTKNRFRVEWSNDILYEAQDHIIDILDKQRYLVPLIDNEKAVCNSYNKQMHDRLHQTLIKMYLQKSKDLDKLEAELRQHGGAEHLAGITKKRAHETSCRAAKAKYYDYLVTSLNNEWNTTGRIKRLVKRMNDKLTSEIKEMNDSFVTYANRVNDDYAPRRHLKCS